MTNCEKCGKRIKEGAVYCSVCIRGLDTKPTKVSEIDTTKNGLEHEIFSFKARPSKIVKLKRLLPLIFSGFIVIIGLVTIYADLTSSEVPPMILPIGIMIIGLLIIYLITRSSHEDPFLFLSLSILILTLGIAMLDPKPVNLILPIGTSLVGLFLVFLLFRHLDRNRALSLALVIIIVSLGTSMAFPDSTTFILAISFILTGLMILIVKL